MKDEAVVMMIMMTLMMITG